MAQVVGPQGRIVAYEVDAALAAEARQNLAAMPWVSVRHGDASGSLDETFNAMLINAGVTHPLNAWLDRLESGGRLMLPLTGSMPSMGANIGKGLVWQLTKQDGYFDARVLAFVAIYSAIGLREETLNERLGKAMMAGPAQWQRVKRLRRDTHEPGSSCWLHGDGFCFSRED
jgi:protein-L-isoaspartate(D-aspartate) O-methyltransferase